MKRTVFLILSVILLCLACAVQATGQDLPVFASVRDVIDHTEGDLIIQDGSEYIVLILEMDGRYLRMAAMLDSRAKDLYKPVEAEDHSVSDIKTFEEYAWALPLTYAEELPAKPKDQAELDSLKGKTIRNLMDEGFGKLIILSDYSLLESPVSICLEYGFYQYEFEVTDGASGDPYLMTVRSGKYKGFSRAAFDIDYHGIPSDPQ